MLTVCAAAVTSASLDCSTTGTMPAGCNPGCNTATLIGYHEQHQNTLTVSVSLSSTVIHQRSMMVPTVQRHSFGKGCQAATVPRHMQQAGQLYSLAAAQTAALSACSLHAVPACATPVAHSTDNAACLLHVHQLNLHRQQHAAATVSVSHLANHPKSQNMHSSCRDSW